MRGIFAVALRGAACVVDGARRATGAVGHAAESLRHRPRVRRATMRLTREERYVEMSTYRGGRAWHTDVVGRSRLLP
ncbi:hypothetical protein BCEP4_450025 [Burkholderia cepacia]|nr:hypothetical protein BCEP4_450025 [Burkholderia cepacia]